ncbi:MAG: AMP-dependent synthetase, partial [bacterium]|nr:AMP-dependent synthetase [bacterium]
VPAAAVVLRPGAELNADGLRTHLGGRLAPYKIPAHVWFRRSPLPRNASGKYLKRQVRDELLSP